MSDSASRLPAHPSLEQLHKQAKDLLKQYRAGEASVVKRFRTVIPRLLESSDVGGLDRVTLADAQFVLAREHGFESWAKLKRQIESLPSPRLELFERLAGDIVAVCRTDDAEALERITELYGRTYPYRDRRTQLQTLLSAVRGSESRIEDIALDDARLIVARRFGFDSWQSLADSINKRRRSKRAPSSDPDSSPPFYKIDWQHNAIEVRMPLSTRDWNRIFGAMKEHNITALKANGQMTDSAMEGLAKIEHVTRLHLEGSNQLTDAGLKHLARMPQLRELDLSGWNSQITDRGLEVVRYLRELRRFQMCWPQGISDAGAANLTDCDQLESVDLLGTPTGDGAIRALVGKPNLRRLKTGKQVTDAGLPLLHQFPVFKTWRGGEVEYSLMSADAEPNHLLLDGPFTSNGLAAIVGLDGLFALTFFWHVSELTSEGLKSLVHLPRLGFLGCQDELCDDVAMGHIGALPGLRMLMGQGTVASDVGFMRLSSSRTLEYIWGRECPNLKGRGFVALSSMPALHGLAVSCKNVDDAALSYLPRFPALRALMPMDVMDDGFRHVGRCEQLEQLWCMYCRETGDAATEHIQELSQLKSYYAGASKITDRSLEILARMSSLERLEFYQCAGITNAGLALLAGLPRLREIAVSGSPNVTVEGMSVFPSTVSANYW